MADGGVSKKLEYLILNQDFPLVLFTRGLLSPIIFSVACGHLATLSLQWSRTFWVMTMPRKPPVPSQPSYKIDFDATLRAKLRTGWRGDVSVLRAELGSGRPQSGARGAALHDESGTEIFSSPWVAAHGSSSDGAVKDQASKPPHTASDERGEVNHVARSGSHQGRDADARGLYPGS